jgi:nucleotide-binding universal stress UspA family protein
MYNEILVPLDGSKLAEGVLPYARCFAEAFSVPVKLLHINDPEVVAAYSHPMQGEDYLKDLARSALAGLSVNVSVEIGKPAEVIADIGAGRRDALIAMATHGRSGIRRWLLGSVAEKVLHATVNPLLVVRPEEKPPSGPVRLKTVLVPLDGSHLAEKVLPHARAIAAALKAELVLTRVFSAPIAAQVVSEGVRAPDFNQVKEALRKEARTYLEEKVEALRAGDGADVSHILMEGDSAAEIIDLARKTPDNLLAMCTHGRTGVSRWVIGSVTERVVRHSGDPVLVIRA